VAPEPNSAEETAGVAGAGRTDEDVAKENEGEDPATAESPKL
jgi:hypothetical protein